MLLLILIYLQLQQQFFSHAPPAGRTGALHLSAEAALINHACTQPRDMLCRWRPPGAGMDYCRGRRPADGWRWWMLAAMTWNVLGSFCSSFIFALFFSLRNSMSVELESINRNELWEQSEICGICLSILTCGASCCQLVAVGCWSVRNVKQLPRVTVLY